MYVIHRVREICRQKTREMSKGVVHEYAPKYMVSIMIILICPNTLIVYDFHDNFIEISRIFSGYLLDGSACCEED